jgi:uncharacterized protein
MTGGDSRSGQPAADAPLIWNVSGLLGDSAGAVRDYAIHGVEIDGREDFTLASPIEGRVHLGRTNRGLLVDADFTTTLATQCARCLRDVTVPLAFEIDDEALPAIDIHSGRALAISADDEEAGVIRLTDHHELDLEDCPGLCIVCGLPLDEGRHDHPADDIDPRLEALKGFRPDRNG